MENRFGKIVYATLLLLLCSAPAFAQPYRKLTSGDFRGAPQPGSAGELAFTNCMIEYSYTPHPRNGYYELDFNIKLVMLHDQSWMDRRKIPSQTRMDEILKHEQGHYNLAYLEQQELLRTVARTVFRDDYKDVANAIFQRIDAKYHMLNENYDTDTENSSNRVQQHSWDVYFDKVLLPMVGNRYYASATANESALLPENR